MSLVRVKDDRTKSLLPARLIWTATKYFDTKNVQPSVDADIAEGFEDLHGMNPDHFYHNERRLREQGLREIPRDSYPSPYGGTLYNDEALFRAAKELRNVEGRNWETLQIAVWEKLNKIFDMSEYHPRGDEKYHLLGRMTSMQRIVFDALNILTQAKDQTKKDVLNATTRLPRSYAEWVDLHQEVVGTVRALEMSHGKKEGSEEAETMRAMIQFQLRNENTVPS
jgi:hypothetical protein